MQTPKTVSVPRAKTVRAGVHLKFTRFYCCWKAQLPVYCSSSLRHMAMPALGKGRGSGESGP